MSSVSSGKLSGRIKYLIVDPRMLMLSSEMVSAVAPAPRAFGVIFTVRRAVFICGEIEAIVPCRIVPFLSSIVTVSLAHFMRNLFELVSGFRWWLRIFAGRAWCVCCLYPVAEFIAEGWAYLTSFMFAVRCSKSGWGRFDFG